MYGAVSSMLRSCGVLTAPSTATRFGGGLSRRASESGLPNGSRPPTPISSAVGLTPVLKKPVSPTAPPSPVVTDSVRLPVTCATEARVSSGPEWHLSHWPLPLKMPSPRSSWSFRALWFPARNWSNLVWLATSVVSYSCTERPQKSEKLYSVWLNWLVLPGVGATGVPLASTVTPEAHHCGLKAAWIRAL